MFFIRTAVIMAHNAPAQSTFDLLEVRGLKMSSCLLITILECVYVVVINDKWTNCTNRLYCSTTFYIIKRHFTAV